MNIYVLTYTHYDEDGFKFLKFKEFFSTKENAFNELHRWFEECYNIVDKRIDWKIESVELDSNKILTTVASGHIDYEDVDRWNYIIYLYKGNEVIKEIPLSRVK